MKILRLPWKGRQVPYGVLDVIRGCNCRCAACYNQAEARIKSLEEVTSELAILRAARAVDYVGICGGEPLLHPDLPEIVKLIRSAGLSPVLLTNGISWTPDQARRLRAEGLEMVFFHLQIGQIRPDLLPDASLSDLVALATEKCRSARAEGIDTALSFTVSPTRAEELSTCLTAFRQTPDCNYMLLTVEHDMNDFAATAARTPGANGLAALTAQLAVHGWLPFAGLGGRVHPETWRWLTFHALQRVDASGQETDFAALPPSCFERLIFALLKVCGCRLPFKVKSGRGGLLARVILNALTGGPWRNLSFAWGTLTSGDRLEGKHILAEAFADWQSNGQVDYCNPCLDATVRDGRLVPLCLVDTPLAKEDLPCA